MSYPGAKIVPVLVEEQHKGKWRGRTPQNKLVFFEDAGNWHGKMVDLEITWTGPWSMQGRLPGTDDVVEGEGRDEQFGVDGRAAVPLTVVESPFSLVVAGATGAGATSFTSQPTASARRTMMTIRMPPSCIATRVTDIHHKPMSYDYTPWLGSTMTGSLAGAPSSTAAQPTTLWARGPMPLMLARMRPGITFERADGAVRTLGARFDEPWDSSWNARARSCRGSSSSSSVRAKRI